MIQVIFKETHLDDTMSLVTEGLDAYGKPELILQLSQKLKGTPLETLNQLLVTLANEIVTHDLSNGAMVSFGNYGELRLVAEGDGLNQTMLHIRDVDAESRNALRFVERLFVLTGFEHMGSGSLSEALELFDAGIQIQPDNAASLHARASVTHDLLVKGEIEGQRAGRLSLGLFEDLLRSIELAPDIPEAYSDLLAMLKSFRPLEMDSREHQKWVRKIVELALTNSSHNPETIKVQRELEKFGR